MCFYLLYCTLLYSCSLFSWVYSCCCVICYSLVCTSSAFLHNHRTIYTSSQKKCECRSLPEKGRHEKTCPLTTTMLVLRRLRLPASTLTRCNATLQATESASVTPPPPVAPTKETIKPTAATHETKSSSSSTASLTRVRRKPAATRLATTSPQKAGRTPKWRPALPTGVLPAYDEAIKLIRQDSFRLRHEAAEVRRSIKPGDEDEEEKRKLLRIIQVQSEINLPEVRWAVKSRLVDMRNPAHRHLREQNWRGEGKLDLLVSTLLFFLNKNFPDFVDGTYAPNERDPGRPSVAPSEYRCLYQGPPDASCRPDISQSWYRARRVPQSQADNRASDGVRDRLPP